MEKKNLKNGMIIEVVWCNGDIDRYVIIGHGMYNNEGYNLLKQLDEQLRFESGEIIKVFINERMHSLEDISNDEALKLIWERESEVDWSKVEKYTKVQVRDREDNEWRNRYFIRFDKGQRKYYTVIQLPDEFTGIKPNYGIPYKYCRLYKED